MISEDLSRRRFSRGRDKPIVLQGCLLLEISQDGCSLAGEIGGDVGRRSRSVGSGGRPMIRIEAHLRLNPGGAMEVGVGRVPGDKAARASGVRGRGAALVVSVAAL